MHTHTHCLPTPHSHWSVHTHTFSLLHILVGLHTHTHAHAHTHTHTHTLFSRSTLIVLPHDLSAFRQSLSSPIGPEAFLPHFLWPLCVAAISLRSLSADPPEGPTSRPGVASPSWCEVLSGRCVVCCCVSSASFCWSFSRVLGNCRAALYSLRNTWPGLETFKWLPCSSEPHDRPGFGDAQEGLIQG